MLEIKNTVAEMNSAFYGHIGRLDAAEERTCKPKHMTLETSKTEKQKQKKTENNKRIEYSRTVEQLQKIWLRYNGNTRRRRKIQRKRNNI